MQQVLAGESFLEKERRLSEMILQLQMVRDQLVQQQDHNKVSDHKICLQTSQPISVKLSFKMLKIIGHIILFCSLYGISKPSGRSIMFYSNRIMMCKHTGPIYQ